MSSKIMKHLSNAKLITSEHSNVISVRKEKLDYFLNQGFEVIQEGDDVCLVGKPMVENIQPVVEEVKATAVHQKPVVARKKTTHRK